MHTSYHKPFELTGPYGLGLQLNSNARGLHLVVCAGTGIIPFLDLLNFLLLRNFFTILSNVRGQQVAQKM